MATDPRVPDGVATGAAAATIADQPGPAAVAAGPAFAEPAHTALAPDAAGSGDQARVAGGATGPADPKEAGAAQTAVAADTEQSGVAAVTALPAQGAIAESAGAAGSAGADQPAAGPAGPAGPTDTVVVHAHAGASTAGSAATTVPVESGVSAGTTCTAETGQPGSAIAAGPAGGNRQGTGATAVPAQTTDTGGPRSTRPAGTAGPEQQPADPAGTTGTPVEATGAARTAGAAVAEEQAAGPAGAPLGLARPAGTAGATVAEEPGPPTGSTVLTASAGPTGSAAAEQYSAVAAGCPGSWSAIAAVADQRPPKQRLRGCVDCGRHALEQGRSGEIGSCVAGRSRVDGLHKPVMKRRRLLADRLISQAVRIDQCGDRSRHRIGAGLDDFGGREDRIGVGGVDRHADIRQIPCRRGKLFWCRNDIRHVPPRFG